MPFPPFPAATGFSTVAAGKGGKGSLRVVVNHCSTGAGPGGGKAESNMPS